MQLADTTQILAEALERHAARQQTETMLVWLAVLALVWFAVAVTKLIEKK